MLSLKHHSPLLHSAASAEDVPKTRVADADFLFAARTTNAEVHYALSAKFEALHVAVPVRAHTVDLWVELWLMP